MPFKLSIFTSLVSAAVVFSGCGSDLDNAGGSMLDLPDGKTLIFYDANSGSQYSYDTDSDTYTSMDVEGQNYDMIGNTDGQIFTWFDPTDGTAIDQKIVMFNSTYDYSIDGNVTSDDFYYLGHFHTEDENQVFAAHSADEFDPDNNASAAKLNALKRLSTSLGERELQKNAILDVLPDTKTLCNYHKIDHTEVEEHEEGEEEELLPYVALTTDGQIYVYEEDENGTLSPLQAAVQLEGVTECTEDTSAIVQYSEEGVLVFSAFTQKLYLVDAHGGDFHQHSSFTVSKFLPTDFTPTQMAGIGEGDHDHDEEE
jgi:hypothetical protein